MHYYIDGYNLLFHLCRGYTKNITEERRAIIEEISSFVDELGLHATVVFDGHTPKGDLQSAYHSDLEVLFTEKGETADEWIINYVKYHRRPNQVVVVTSDKRLAWRVRNHSAQTEDVDVFLKNLRKRSRKSRYPKKPKIEPVLSQVPKGAEPVPVAPSITDYYLELFSARYAQEAAQQQIDVPKPVAKKEQAAASKRPPVTKNPYSAEEYHKIFEERLKKLSEGEV